MIQKYFIHNKYKHLMLSFGYHGPITHLAVMKNYDAAITRNIRFVGTALCVLGPTISK